MQKWASDLHWNFHIVNCYPCTTIYIPHFQLCLRSSNSSKFFMVDGKVPMLHGMEPSTLSSSNKTRFSNEARASLNHWYHVGKSHERVPGLTFEPHNPSRYRTYLFQITEEFNITSSGLLQPLVLLLSTYSSLSVLLLCRRVGRYWKRSLKWIIRYGHTWFCNTRLPPARQYFGGLWRIPFAEKLDIACDGTWNWPSRISQSAVLLLNCAWAPTERVQTWSVVPPKRRRTYRFDASLHPPPSDLSSPMLLPILRRNLESKCLHLSSFHRSSDYCIRIFRFWNIAAWSLRMGGISKAGVERWTWELEQVELESFRRNHNASGSLIESSVVKFR